MHQTRFRIYSTAAMLAVLSVGGTAMAQQPAVQQQPGQNAAPVQYRVKQILGTSVNIEGNTSVGTVEDLVFDDSGMVEYLIVANQGKMVTVPWEAAKFNFEKRTAMVNIAPDRFQKIPTYTADQYPLYSTPAYRTQTYQYYGLTPGQARRINRNLP